MDHAGAGAPRLRSSPKIPEGSAPACVRLQSGIGQERALAAFLAALDACPVTGVLHFGFGAAAVPDLAVGDVLVCAGFQTTRLPPLTARLDADPALPAQTQQALGLRLGECLTVDRLAADPEEKRRLGQIYGVQVIDMESYALADAARRRRLPYLAVRAISDGVAERLPPYDALIAPDGGLRWPAALRRWLTHPGDLPGLLRVARHARRARAGLAAWLPRLIPMVEAHA